MKKVLFIDRDGTIIVEPSTDFQIDSFEKLEFIPGAITYLRKIRTELDFMFVMVTNQDGLGTPSFPEDTFWPAHNFMLKTLLGEGITFDEIHIDKSFEHENLPTRKPRTGLLEHFKNQKFDLKNSFVIGDRITDIQLANNLGCGSIFYGSNPSEKVDFNASSWEAIYHFLRSQNRRATINRNTNETKIHIELNLDGSGKTDIQTGLGFFDHMLSQIGRHANVDLSIKVEGDLHVDEHHTIEDTAIALGEVFYKALGNKKGINRYGFLLPMDDTLAQVAIDFGGRPWLVWQAEFKREKVGDMPTEMFFHFFKSFADAAKCNLNIKVEGDNEHHKIEAIFKALAKSIKLAIKQNPEELDQLPSTKGVL